MTSNYHTLAKLAELLFFNRELYYQVARNYNETALFLALSNQEKSILLRFLDHKHVRPYLKHLKIKQATTYIRVETQALKDLLIKKNKFVLPYGHKEVLVVYLHTDDGWHDILMKFFSDLPSYLSTFLENNGLIEKYKTLLIRELETGIDPSLINRGTLINRASLDLIYETHKKINTIHSFLNKQPHERPNIKRHP